MTGVRLLAATVCAFLVALGLFASPNGIPAAHACSIGTFGTAERHREELLTRIQGSDLVLVGTVVREQRAGSEGESRVYVSDVAVEAVLAGEAPGQTLPVRMLEYDDTFCTGGPRLREHEKVLLALDDAGDTWELHNLGKVLLAEDEAISQYASAGVEIGDTDPLLRDVAALFAAGPGAEAAAIAAANTPVPGRDGGIRWLPISLVVLAAGGIAVALVIRQRSAGSRRDI